MTGSDSKPTSDPDQTTAMHQDDETPVERLAMSDEVLDDFRLLRRLGKGGMAEVWLAEQESLKRNVALKLLRPDLTQDSTYVARFQTEAKAAAGLNHPNIVQVYTVGDKDGQYFIAQEYVEGATLKSFIKKKGPLDVKLALKIMRQVASALRSAAEKGIVHRDIKPENIMLNRKGEAKVADFGLAQLQGGERLDLTQEGVTMGTPLYMSPEQVNGKKLDQRSDIYSFGISCYHMLTGRPPFEGDNAVSVAVKHLHETPEPLQKVRSDLPISVCRLIEKMIAKNPDDRYSNADDILSDIRKIAKALETGESVDHLFEDSPNSMRHFPTKRPALAISVLAVIIALASAGIAYSFRQELPEPDPNQLRIPKENSAREQYKSAMFQVDNENAFKAVIQYHLSGPWVDRAQEQLALMYLSDPNRKDDASKQLAIFTDQIGSEEFKNKAFIGKAYLAAINGNLDSAKSQLLRANLEANELSESWKQLADDARKIIEDAESGNSENN